MGEREKEVRMMVVGSAGCANVEMDSSAKNDFFPVLRLDKWTELAGAACSLRGSKLWLVLHPTFTELSCFFISFMSPVTACLIVLIQASA